ncbi:Sorbicillinoid biosynthetic cluster transcription factor 1 [Fusarium oxysporum f. sp. albedinis]|nr:Sorbicillinoid biosynthetic cluster transcription factor 1 [Fusarium oxysporum f. sp. albedinis]
MGVTYLNHYRDRDLGFEVICTFCTTFLQTIHDSTSRNLPKENRNSLVLLIPHLVDYLETKIDFSMDLPYLK